MSEEKVQAKDRDATLVPALEEGQDIIDEKKLLRKIDWHLLPALIFLFFLSFLDRSNGTSLPPFALSCAHLLVVGNARIEGLAEDTHMSTFFPGVCACGGRRPHSRFETSRKPVSHNTEYLVYWLCLVRDPVEYRSQTDVSAVLAPHSHPRMGHRLHTDGPHPKFCRIPRRSVLFGRCRERSLPWGRVLSEYVVQAKRTTLSHRVVSFCRNPCWCIWWISRKLLCPFASTSHSLGFRDSHLPK